MASVKEQAMLKGLQACNYSAMGALIFTLWDIIITTGEEVERIWKKPWTHLKTLYLFLRWFPLVSQILSAVISMQYAAGRIPTTKGCQIWVAFQGVASVVILIGVQMVLVLRVLALYHDNRLVQRLIPVLFFVEIGATATVFGCGFSGIKYGSRCVVISFPTLSAGFFTIPILFEFVLFALTMRKFYLSLREGWGNEPFISRFMKDGIWVFLLPFSILTVNTCCMALLDSATSSIAYSWAIAIPGVAGYRLILSMSHLLKMSSRRGPSTSMAGSFITDTVPAHYTFTDNDCLYELDERDTHR